MSKSAIIIDDELKSIIALRTMLEHHCPFVEIIGQATSVSSGIEAIKTLKPQLVFLDVEMADGNGFDLLEKLGENVSFEVIFITAFDHYALKAFRFCALDYLLKPVDPDLLKEAVNKLQQQSSFPEKIKTLQNNLNGQKKIVLPSKEEFFVVEIEDILRCEANGNYTIFFLRDQKSLLISKTLKEFDDLLNELNFVRIHKSHLVNMKFVERYLPKDSMVVMKDGACVELSRRKKEVFLEQLFNQ